MNRYFLNLNFLLILLLFCGLNHAKAGQSDTVRVQSAVSLPSIDGSGNDDCWTASGVNWEPIDQVWMPWKGIAPSSADFSGRYKVIWNKDSNLLYFLVEVTDDSFIDGYDFASNGPSGYPNYDVVEIFLDENRSKGPHVFDNGSENAQNAFSYHISVNAPADNETTDQFTVEDLEGTDWSRSWVVNYASHFPEFIMKKSGNNYSYEFALKVYNDTYPTQQKNGNTSSDPERARVSLSAGKIMGITMAYCDNDTNDGKRDHFFGSTPGKEYTANFGFSGTQNSISTENGQKIFNTCWMSASDYGVMKLQENLPTSLKITDKTERAQILISPFNKTNQVNVQINSDKTGEVVVEVINLAGEKVKKLITEKTAIVFSTLIDLNELKKGMYLTRVQFDNQVSVQKIVKP